MDKPLVEEKNPRRREMVSHKLTERGGKNMIMHEGYVDDRKYLVPDSNLQVMKELVDMKMGKPPRDRYLREYEIIGKLKRTDSKGEEIDKSRKIQFTDEEPIQKKEESETTSSSSSSSSEPSTKTVSVESEKSENSQETEKLEISPDAYRLRFWISGHIRTNLRPIFIIHKNNVRPLFDDGTADFSSFKSKDDVEFIVRGKFYQDSILNEVNGVAKSLILKPHPIPIDVRCRIYENSIQKIFRIGEMELDMEGSFIKQHPNSTNYTPFFTFNVNKTPLPLSKTEKSFTSLSIDSANVREPYLTLGRQVVYFVSKPKTNNIYKPKSLTSLKIIEGDSESYPKPATDQKEGEISNITEDTSSDNNVKDGSFHLKNIYPTVNFVQAHEMSPSPQRVEGKTDSKVVSLERNSVGGSNLSKLNTLKEDAFKRISDFILSKNK